ncbi:MAG TPA: transglutaminase-like cysteine peptidase [Longimicrobium sp.]|jgi:hypothetical protein
MGLFDWLRGTPEPRDPWLRTDRTPCDHHFGPGRMLACHRYLRGNSIVSAPTFDAVRSWLAGCTYVTDEEHFGAPDYWQHPSEFERVRRGDCEDFALWGWRKLVEMGYDAFLVVGFWNPPDGTPCQHAWVLIKTGSGDFVLEGTAHHDAMLQPLETARAHYHPEVGIDRQGVAFTFQGGVRPCCGRSRA